MKINFFEPACQEKISAPRFGLCDDQNGSKAYIDSTNPSKWIAIVKNDANIPITLTAVDNCIAIYRENGELESRCDGMMTYPENIVFVELKEVRTAGWIPGGVDQLKVTISLFGQNHDLSLFRKRRAFLVNKKFPSFQYGHQDLMEHFKNETGVRLIIHNTIKI